MCGVWCVCVVCVCGVCMWCVCVVCVCGVCVWCMCVVCVVEELAGSLGIRVYFITKTNPHGKSPARWLRSLFGNVAGGEEV